MRFLAIAIMLTVAVACLGCESVPPQGIDRAEAAAQSPPRPEEPAEPAPVVDPTAPTGAQATGQAALAKAAEAGAAKRAAAAKKAAEEGPPADGAGAADSAPMPDAPADADAPADDAPAEDDTLKKVEVGVGVKGKDYGGPGFITTPVATMFRARERIALTQMTNVMKIYKAGHNNKGPKTHEEFMDVIIKQNAVQLPELPQGDVYWYDVEKEELMVRSPKQES